MMPALMLDVERARSALSTNRRVQLALCLGALVFLVGTLGSSRTVRGRAIWRLGIVDQHATPRWEPSPVGGAHDPSTGEVEDERALLPLPAGTYSRELYAPNLLPGERYITALPLLGFTNQVRRISSIEVMSSECSGHSSRRRCISSISLA